MTHNSVEEGMLVIPVPGKRVPAQSVHENTPGPIYIENKEGDEILLVMIGKCV